MSNAGSGAREQVGRLLALVPYLQNRTEVPLAQVAADFGVSEQRIRKDLEVLWFCGLPGLGMGDMIEIDMDAVRGEGVVHLTNAEYLSRPLKLDAVEASALTVALRTLREGASDEERVVVDSVLAKLESAIGEGPLVDVRLDSTQARLAPLRDQLSEALMAGRRIRLTYYVPSRDEETERVVDPLAVTEADGQVYLDAWCHQAADQRLFRLDRISAVAVLDEPVSAHPEVAPLDLSEGVFHPSADDLLVTLELDARARWVADYYPVESVAETAAGGLLVSLRVADTGWLVRLVLRLAGRARVLAPAELADAVRATAHSALSAYR